MPQSTREELRIAGFDLIDERLTYLLGCLKDALASAGETELLAHMPWSGNVIDPDAALPEALPKL